MWLTVILALQRFIFIQYPVHSQTLCTVKNVKIAATVIVIFSVICGTPKFFDREFEFFDGWKLKLKFDNYEKKLGERHFLVTFLFFGGIAQEAR